MLYWYYTLVALVLLSVVIQESKLYSKGTRIIVSEDAGIKIEAMGKVVQGNEETLVSVFLKMPDYFRLLNPARKLEKFMATADVCYSMEERSAGMIKTTFELKQSRISSLVEDNKYLETLKSYNYTLNKFIQSRVNILSSYVTPNTEIPVGDQESVLNSTHRHKRQLLALVGGTIISAVTTGIAEYQIHKINSHMSDYKAEIAMLASNIKHQQQGLVALKNRVFGLVKISNFLITDELHRSECNDIYEHFLETWKINFEEYIYVRLTIFFGQL